MSTTITLPLGEYQAMEDTITRQADALNTLIDTTDGVVVIDRRVASYYGYGAVTIPLVVRDTGKYLEDFKSQIAELHRYYAHWESEKLNQTLNPKKWYQLW